MIEEAKDRYRDMSYMLGGVVDYGSGSICSLLFFYILGM
jgi:hypothetical protein